MKNKPDLFDIVFPPKEMVYIESVSTMCEKCHVPWVYDDNLQICPICCICKQYDNLYDNTYKPSSECKNVYSRKNNFRKFLNSIVGRLPVNKDIMGKILSSDMPDPECSSIEFKRYMKQMGLQKYYHLQNSIRSHFITLPELSIHEEEQIYLLHTDLIQAFKYNNENRKNFLSNQFVIAKLFNKIGREDWIPYCTPMIMSRCKPKRITNEELYNKLIDFLSTNNYI